MSAGRPKLELSQESFEAIHKALDSARKTAKQVPISREALAALLRDHAALIAHHRVEA